MTGSPPGERTLAIVVAECATLFRPTLAGVADETVLLDLDPQASAASWKDSWKAETPEILQAASLKTLSNFDQRRSLINR